MAGEALDKIRGYTGLRRRRHRNHIEDLQHGHGLRKCPRDFGRCIDLQREDMRFVSASCVCARAACVCMCRAHMRVCWRRAACVRYVLLMFVMLSVVWGRHPCSSVVAQAIMLPVVWCSHQQKCAYACTCASEHVCAL